jgi:hypothetical protein
MIDYKRNQVEEAISQVLGERTNEPSQDLRTRLKRLLETDRAMGRNIRSSDPKIAQFAFYSENAPGKGVEVFFSPYEAFALMTALRLLQHGWPQSFPVSVLRAVRPELEREHARILKQNPEALFDEKAIRKMAVPGALYVDNADPVFLTVASGQRLPSTSGDDLPLFAVCRGQDVVSRFISQKRAQSWTMHELVTPAHALATQLATTEPRKRGRAG